jgi:branched-chain amino acid transport system substrate-binding protein
MPVRRTACSFLLLVAATMPAAADIVVGIAGPMSGQFASLGNQMRSGAEAAIAAVNAAGGINGEPLKAMVADDACDTKRATDAARQFVAADARLVVGHLCSGSSAAAALLYRDAGIMMITPAATAPALTETGNWNILRVTGRDDAPFRLAAERIKALPDDGAAAIVTTNAIPTAFAAAAMAVLPDAKFITLSPELFRAEDLAAELIAAGSRHVIVALAPTDAAKLVIALSARGFGGIVYGNESLLTDAVTDQLTAVSFDVLAAFPTDPATKATASAIGKVGPEPEGATLPAHAAIEAFVTAAQTRSVNDGRAMADWLKAGNVVNTVLGTIAFDSKGDLATQPFTWYRWTGTSQRFLPE